MTSASEYFWRRSWPRDSEFAWLIGDDAHLFQGQNGCQVQRYSKGNCGFVFLLLSDRYRSKILVLWNGLTYKTQLSLMLQIWTAIWADSDVAKHRFPQRVRFCKIWTKIGVFTMKVLHRWACVAILGSDSSQITQNYEALENLTEFVVAQNFTDGFAANWVWTVIRRFTKTLLASWTAKMWYWEFW